MAMTDQGVLLLRPQLILAFLIGGVQGTLGAQRFFGRY